MKSANGLSVVNKISSFFLVVWITWPWFCQNTGLIAGMIFSAGWCITAVAQSRKFAVGTDGLLMACYVAIMAVSFLYTGKTYGEYQAYYHISMTALFFLPYYMCKFYIDKGEKKFLGKLAIIAIVFIIIGCYTSISYTIIDENIMKTISQAMDTELLEYRKAGIGSFGFIYMLVFAFIGVVGLFKNGRTFAPVWAKVLLIIMCIIGLSCMVASTFTTAIVLVVVGSVLVLISKRKSKSINILIYVSVFFVTYFLSRLIGEILLNTTFDSSDVNVRMHEIGNLLIGNDAGENILSRMKAFTNSLNCFWEYPVLGYNFQLTPTAKLGGHAEWIDMFAVYGIVGGVPLVATVIYKLRKIGNLIKNKIDYQFYGVILFIFVVFGFVDPFLRLYHIGFAMFMLIPCIACIPYVFDKKEAKHENTLGC